MTEYLTESYDYELPPELIAQRPLEPRDSSRLMVVDRSRGTIEHRVFRELPELLAARDLLVGNRSRVIAARLHGSKLPTGGAVEILLLRVRGDGAWDALVRPGKRLSVGTRVGSQSGHGVSPRFSTASDLTRVVRSLPSSIGQSGRWKLCPPGSTT